MKDQKTYFMLPVYNEEDNIKDLILNLRKLMKGREYKIVAVNDGSSDKSLAILKGLEGNDLEIIGSIINMNVGAVFALGIGRILREAKDDDILIIMESDQTSELGLIDELTSEINKNGKDIVIASRYKAGGRYVNFPFFRKVFSYCANWLMHFYFPIKDVIDYTIFFRAYKVGVLKILSTHFGEYGLIQSKGFVANAELLIKASLFTDKISEIPFIYNYGKKKGASKLNVFRTINEYFVLVSYLKRIVKKINTLKEKIRFN